MPDVDDSDDLGATVVTPFGSYGSDEVAPRTLQLVVIGSGTPTVYPIAGTGTLTVGRSPQCEIRIDADSISRRHARVTLGETITIEDLGSANGTRVRGTAIEAGSITTISIGELVGLGTLDVFIRPGSSQDARLVTGADFEARLDDECARDGHFAVLSIRTSRLAHDENVENALDEILRKTDVLCKAAAHEYYVLLLDVSPSSADEAFRRIGDQLLKADIKATTSIAIYPRDGGSRRQLLAKLRTPASSEQAPRGTSVVVSDPQMQELHHLVEQIADSRLSVLILGETGVGKEVFAHAVHRASSRGNGPFIEINCAALTETLLESELFGHEKGAFTNATSAKLGLIETADKGTLLLDEIGEMPLLTQAKLLRVIEDLQVRRVGALKARTIDVRFIAATNIDLEAQIARGTFRRDLFYRLNGVTIDVPPLRERLSEIEPLALAFIARTCPPDRRPPTLAAETIAQLREYRWPGNVRELKQVIERAVLLCGDNPIQPIHLPLERMRRVADASATRLPTMRARASDLPPPKGSPEEQRWIMETLTAAGGNQTVAARMLGLSRRTLVSRLRTYRKKPSP